MSLQGPQPETSTGDVQVPEAVVEPAAEQVGYNPRPRPITPEPRVEVDEVHGFTGTKTRVRVLFGTEGASSLSSVFTLCNSAIGAGVLSLPYAFQCAGLAGCFILCLVVAAMEAFTMYVLAKFSERYDANSYGTLVRRALGRKTAALLSGVTLVYLWGSTVAYFVIIADTFTSISSSYLGPTAFTSSRPSVLLASGLLVLLLCFPRELAALERVSAAAVAGFCYTALAVLIRGCQAVASKPEPWAGIKLFNVDTQALYALSIVVFGFNCHANVVGVFHELEAYPSRLISRLPASPRAFQGLGPLAPRGITTYKLIGMLGAIISAMSIILTGYMAVGVAGYMAYPDKVSSNVLNSFPADDLLLQVARAVIGCVVMGHIPVNHHPARKSWEDLLDSAANVKAMPRWVSWLLSLLFIGTTVATALVVTDLGAVLHMIGGTAASFMIFFLPGLLMMNAAIIKHTSSYVSLSQLAGDDNSSEAGAASSAAAGEDVQTPRSVPLLDKKSGIRDAGLIFVSESKTWLAGLLLVVASGVVLAVTLVTAALD